MECKKMERTANKNRQFFQPGDEKVKEAVEKEAVLLFNGEFVICSNWIHDLYVSRIQFVISWIHIHDMYISLIQIRDM